VTEHICKSAFVGLSCKYEYKNSLIYGHSTLKAKW